MAQGENLFRGAVNPQALSSWSTTGATKTVSTETTPVQGFTPVDVVEDGATTFHGITQVPSSGGADPYVIDDKARYAIGTYAKAQGRNFLLMLMNSSAIGIWFDLQNGLIGTETGLRGTIENAGNGWYFCVGWINFGTRLTWAASVQLLAAPSNGALSYAGTNGLNAISLAAPHLVKANYPEPLVATSNSARKVGPIENSLKGLQV